jgi:hypothetical protein
MLSSSRAAALFHNLFTFIPGVTAFPDCAAALNDVEARHGF